MSTFPLSSLDSDSIPKTSLKMCVLFSLTKKKLFLTLKILFVFLVLISSRTRMQSFDWVLLFSLDTHVGHGWTQLDTDTVGHGWTCWTRFLGVLGLNQGGGGSHYTVHTKYSEYSVTPVKVIVVVGSRGWSGL